MTTTPDPAYRDPTRLATAIFIVWIGAILVVAVYHVTNLLIGLPLAALAGFTGTMGLNKVAGEATKPCRPIPTKPVLAVRDHNELAARLRSFSWRAYGVTLDTDTRDHLLYDLATHLSGSRPVDEEWTVRRVNSGQPIER